jgi:hypothetical protein
MGNSKPQKNPKIHEIPIQLNFDFKHPKKNRIWSRVGILDLMDFWFLFGYGFWNFWIFDIFWVWIFWIYGFSRLFWGFLSKYNP